MLDRQEVKLGKHYKDFENITTDKLEAWLRFTEMDLYEYLVKKYDNVKENIRTILVSPSLLKRESENGNTVQVLQGVYGEACRFKDLFARMREEYELRISELDRVAAAGAGRK